MNNKNDGGPAFPEISCYKVGDGIQEKINCKPGMSLRDYFAAMAMQGLLIGWINCSDDDADFIVNRAYYMADAMIAEKNQLRDENPNGEAHHG